MAVQSVYFLATGTDNFFEGNLTLSKFLCNYPIQMPINRENLLPAGIKHEADKLLNAVIKNWPALKNTTSTGLREMFFRREGKLIENDNAFKLVIERKTQDILLDKIQWNISVLKLPWKRNVIFVDW